MPSEGLCFVKTSSLSNTVEQIRPVNGFIDITRTTGTGRETVVYKSYRSWNNGDLRVISTTALLPRQLDPYLDSTTMVYESYRL